MSSKGKEAKRQLFSKLYITVKVRISIRKKKKKGGGRG